MFNGIGEYVYGHLKTNAKPEAWACLYELCKEKATGELRLRRRTVAQLTVLTMSCKFVTIPDNDRNEQMLQISALHIKCRGSGGKRFKLARRVARLLRSNRLKPKNAITKPSRPVQGNETLPLLPKSDTAGQLFQLDGQSVDVG
uniref:KIND domain-containing protein n=1 Tax=Trichuris muris TaxID=70415 RepID=A0A5S6QWM0_TRIMR